MEQTGINRKPRCSKLPVLQFCGQAQIIGEGNAGNRDSVLGQAFHALCSDDPSIASRMLLLTDEERKDLGELIKPRPFEVNTGTETITLHYENALKEVAIGLTESGEYCDYDDASALVNGTADMCWVVEIGGKVVVYSPDIKRSMYTEPDGPFSLQVTAYCIALASKYGADGYVRGIWDATEGEYSWADYVDVWGEQADTLLRTVVAAAKNHGGDFNLGTHCFRCHARMRCPQYVLPPDLACTMLEPFTKMKGDEGAPTEEYLVEAISWAKRAADSADAVMTLVRSFAKDMNGINDATSGKVFRPVQCKGRVSLDKKRLEKDHPELIEAYSNIGGPYDQYRWTNQVK